MHRAPLGAVRPRLARSLGRTLAVTSLSGALALGMTFTVGRAATAVVGTVEVANLSFTVNFSCQSACPVSATATSSGELAGIDGATPFTVQWTDQPTGAPNVSAQISYGLNCTGPLWLSAGLAGSGMTISGATLTYGTASYPATIQVAFGGQLYDGAMVPMSSGITISGGPSTLVVNELGVPGYLAATPSGASVTCPGGSQTFTASGVFLTLG